MLTGKKALVTAGPTYEPIDPVRFIGNHSSGKMGYAIAQALSDAGAEVTLVSGPTALSKPASDIKLIKIQTAQDMYDACFNIFKDIDIAVLSAAVADYKPKIVETKKIKKSDNNLNIELEPTIDILASLGKIKKKNQVLVGFALETNDGQAAAKRKIEAKNLDFIVLNVLSSDNPCFGVDNNSVLIIDNNYNVTPINNESKQTIAVEIVNKIAKYFT